MKFIEALKLRYATKLYDPALEVDPITIDEIAEILRLSPSSINSQPWKFTIITDTKVKADLAENSFFNKQKIEDAPVLIVFSIYDNLESFERWASIELPQPNQDYYNSVVKPMGREAIKCWFSNQLYIVDP
ncbi:MAG: nitroreductase family protein [Rikenellaceae bacterium]